MALSRLKSRREFLRVAGRGRKVAMPGLVLQAMARDCRGAPEGEALRVGFTASKKVGNAVHRNRAKRRLRALAEEMLPLYGRPGHDYVLICRGATIERDFGALGRDLRQALERIGGAEIAGGDTSR